MDHSSQKSIEEALRSLERSSNTLSALEAVCQINEVANASIVFLKYLGSQQTHPFVRTTYPSAWVSHYLQNGYLDADPTLKHARQNKNSFFWNEVDVDEVGFQLMSQAAQYGVMPVGYVISVNDKRSNLSAFSINSGFDEIEWVKFVQNNLGILQDIANKLHTIAVQEIENVYPARFMKLSKREIEVLQWTAEGKSYFEIGIILELSENTVRGYSKSARLKLDSVSISQAVSRATKLGLI